MSGRGVRPGDPDYKRAEVRRRAEWHDESAPGWHRLQDPETSEAWIETEATLPVEP